MTIQVQKARPFVCGTLSGNKQVASSRLKQSTYGTPNLILSPVHVSSDQHMVHQILFCCKFKLNKSTRYAKSCFVTSSCLKRATKYTKSGCVDSSCLRQSTRYAKSCFVASSCLNQSIMYTKSFFLSSVHV